MTEHTPSYTRTGVMTLTLGWAFFLDPPLIGLIYLEQDHYQMKIM